MTSDAKSGSVTLPGGLQWACPQVGCVCKVFILQVRMPRLNFFLHLVHTAAENNNRSNNGSRFTQSAVFSAGVVMRLCWCDLTGVWAAMEVALFSPFHEGAFQWKTPFQVTWGE